MRSGRQKAALFAGLFLSFLLIVPPVPAGAAEASTVTSIGGPEALDAFARSVRDGQTYAGLTVTLTADIDMAGRTFTSVGVTAGDDFSRVFQGTFDGGGHTISNLAVTADPDSDGAGFFSGLYNAAVRDLTLTNMTVAASGAASVGGLAGRTVNASVSRVLAVVYLTADTWPTPADGCLAAGGLIGRADGRTVLDRCAVRGHVGAAGAFSGSVYAGGLIGCLHSGGSDGRVSNCYATAGLYVNDRGVYVGGLAGGLLADGGYTVLENCYAAASMLIAGDDMAGGFFGAADGSVMAQNVWYDADLAAGLPNGGNEPMAGLTGAPTTQMQGAGFPGVLKEAFAPDSLAENGGYPILDWQAPAPTATPMPTATPAPTEVPEPTDTPAVPTATAWPTSPPIPTAAPSRVPATSPPLPYPSPTPAPFAPRTGDRTAIFPWLGLFCLGGGALAWLVRRRRP